MVSSIGRVADFDFDDNSDSADDDQHGGFAAQGGANFGRFGNYGDNQFRGYDGHRNRHCRDPE
jgi:hypothetical protein